MSSNLQYPISIQAQICIRRFEDVASLCWGKADSDHHLSYSLVTDEAERFKIWSGSVGAICTPGRQDASLDGRLTVAPKIASRVLEFLEDLAHDLDSVWEIASGERRNRTGTLQTSEEIEDVNLASIDTITEVEELSEINELFQTCQDCISCLFRLSVAIRKATNRDRYAQSARKRDNPFDDFFDIAHVGHRFPKLCDSPWLETRLGRAITRRREFIRYSREHHHRLAKPTEQIVEEQKQPIRVEPAHVQDGAQARVALVADTSGQNLSTLGSTKATTLDVAQMEQSTEPGAISDEERSESSYATTEITSETEGILRIPPLPEIGENGKEFPCPYCWTLQCFKGKARRSRQHWKKHVFNDLRPYICTFQGCDLDMFSDKDTWFKHELDDHRVQWSCQFCSNKPMNSADQLEQHLEKNHSKSLNDVDMSALLQSSQHSVRIIYPSSCPFCDPEVGDEELPLDISTFRIHVAKHLEQLALFAIPRTADVDDESFSSGKAALTAPNIPDGIEAETLVSGAEPDDLPFHFAAHEGRGIEVKRLLRNGQDVDALGRTWGTALGAAVEGNQLAVVNLLLEYGADVLLPCGKYETALAAAVASGNPTFKKILNTAQTLRQRPLQYGQIRWKIESIGGKMDNVAAVFAGGILLTREDGSMDLEHYRLFSRTIGEVLRSVSSKLDLRSERQATSLRDVLPVLPQLLDAFEFLHEIFSLIIENLKTYNAEVEAFDARHVHKFAYFNESVMQLLRQDPDNIGHRPPTDETSLRYFLSTKGESLLDKLQRIMKRANSSPAVIDARSFSEDITEFRVHIMKSHQTLKKGLQEVDNDRENKLAYFDTYPDDPDVYHSRRAAGITPEPEPYLSKTSQQKAREALFGPAAGAERTITTEPKLPKSSQQKAREALFGPATVQRVASISGLSLSGSSRDPDKSHTGTSGLSNSGPNELVSMPKLETNTDTRQNTDPKSMNADLKTTHSTNEEEATEAPEKLKFTDSEITEKLEFSKRMQNRVLAIFDQHRNIVDSVRSVLAIVAEHDRQMDVTSLMTACKTIQNWLNLLRDPIDIEITKELLIEGKSGPTLDDDEESLEKSIKNLKDSLSPIRVVSNILQEAISEESAAKPSGPGRASWSSVLEIFEWKAGYPLQQAWLDCATVCADAFNEASQEPGPLPGKDTDAPFRLQKMLDYRQLFD